MLEALLITSAIAALQWWHSPWSYLFAGMLLLMSLPGILVMRGAAPFVTTPKKTMRAMLALATIQPGEIIFDLGCGDGRLVFAAAVQGAVTTGYEMSVPAFLIAKLRSVFHPGSRIVFGNFWRQRFGNADVIFCYFLKDTMHDFERRIWPTLKPGCRVVSHAFTMEHVRTSDRVGDAILYVKI